MSSLLVQRRCVRTPRQGRPVNRQWNLCNGPSETRSHTKTLNPTGIVPRVLSFVPSRLHPVTGRHSRGTDGVPLKGVVTLSGPHTPPPALSHSRRTSLALRPGASLYFRFDLGPSFSPCFLSFRFSSVTTALTPDVRRSHLPESPGGNTQSPGLLVSPTSSAGRREPLPA